MEIKAIKEYLSIYRRPIFCLRLVLTYWIAHLLAIHSGVFEHGITKGAFYAAAVVILMLYRLLCMSLVPAVLVVWIFEIIGRKRCS